MDDFISLQIKIYIEYWLFVYCGLWLYLCLLPFVRLVCSSIFEKTHIYMFLRTITPYSYTIAENHYDLDYDYSSSLSRQIYSPISIRVPLSLYIDRGMGIDREEEEGNDELDLRCLANEQWHIVCDGSGCYHIGLIIEVFDIYAEPVLRVDISVSVSTFYRFPMDAAKQYLIDYIESVESVDDFVDTSGILAYNIGHNIRVDGLRDFPDGSVLTIKTYWIRIIQRRWKRIYAEKMRLLWLRGGLRAQRNFEICGKYGIPSSGELDYSRIPKVPRNERTSERS
jgi:hypothetical protein